MVRTVISLEQADKDWLDARASEEGVPMTELIRRAVRLLREHNKLSRPERDELLKRTSGIWKHEDGLDYQERIRGEW
ncbi:hypothetical protein ABI59_14160 [Acidobacteria bacterium Mor1]|nr:hypothetical protein ABI59_14160 [Acidobacteria bacterium Mor1]